MEAPLAVARSVNSLPDAAAALAQGVVALHDRFFVLCDATVPLHYAASPVKVQVWAELQAEQFAHVLDVLKGERKHFDGYAHLACEWPGFPGSVGSPVYLKLDAEAGARPRVIHCVDRRIAEIGRRRRLEHEDYVKLYRRVWGGPEDVVDADIRIRQAVIDTLHELAGHRQVFLKPVEPPARFAGIEPAAILFQPPFDTGTEALLGTVGIAEAMPGESRVELVSWVCDPSDEFQRSFGELAYWSRSSRNILRSGVLIVEEGGVASSDDKTAWLVCEPWWRERLPEIHVEDARIELLAAVPISREEQSFAERKGPRELVGLMQSSDVDIFDLKRKSAL